MSNFLPAADAREGHAQDEDVDSRRSRGHRVPPCPAIGRLIKERVCQRKRHPFNRMELLTTDSCIKITAT